MITTVTYVEQLMVSDTSSDEKVLRSRHHVIAPSVLSMTLPRKRRQLMPEELEQRRKKVCILLLPSCVQTYIGRYIHI